MIVLPGSNKRTIRLVLLIVFSIACIGSWYAQKPPSPTQDDREITAKLKSIFIYNFTRYFEWEKQDSIKEFRIGTLGADSHLVEALQSLASRKKKSNQAIKVLVYDKKQNPNALIHLDILYVDILNCPFFKLPKGLKNTLVVTEYDRDLSNTMIAFIRDKEKIKFVFNEYLTNQAGLKINPDFKTVAFAVIESNERYEINKSLIRNNWLSVLDKINEGVEMGADNVSLSTAELKEVSEKFKKQSADLETQKQMIDQQLASIQSQESRIKLQEQKLELTKAQNAIQEKELLWKKEELLAQRKRIEKQKSVLEVQKQNIKKQEDKIYSQLQQINTQKTILWLALLAGLAILSSLALLFYNYKKTQKTNQLLAAQNQQIQNQKNTIEEKQNEILDSITYARRIQRALLASDELLASRLNEYFIVFKPKDVVSGDFYWASDLNNGDFALVTADSTGHGVPGAIMSMLNIACLVEAVESKQHNNPKDILNFTRSRVIGYLAKDGSAEGGKDGMDCSLMAFNFKNMKLNFAGAHNPVWIIRDKSLTELSPDKMPIGKHDRDQISFNEQSFALQSGDMIYTLTDGLPDQFGGPKGKKFMYKRLKEELINIAHLPSAEQKQNIERALADWQGIVEQVDDISLIGIRV